ncbi:MAG TPA: gamma-glutamylcyclotransferase [Candidatus Binatia bacterium]|nr:gamma-glutamylcyclotransferase [Candidatus Binatia bacterium]
MSETIRFFICGSALRGQPDHYVVAGARFLGAMQTAPRYRMHSVDGKHPAVYAVSSDGVAVLGELYGLPADQHRALLAQEPPNLYEDDVVLEDGSHARAMLFPRRLVDLYSYPDISQFGSWAAYKEAER